MTNWAPPRDLVDLPNILCGARGFHDPRPGPACQIGWSCLWLGVGKHTPWTAKLSPLQLHQRDENGFWWPLSWEPRC